MYKSKQRAMKTFEQQARRLPLKVWRKALAGSHLDLWRVSSTPAPTSFLPHSHYLWPLPSIPHPSDRLWCSTSKVEVEYRGADLDTFSGTEMSSLLEFFDCIGALEDLRAMSLSAGQYCKNLAHCIDVAAARKTFEGQRGENRLTKLQHHLVVSSITHALPSVRCRHGSLPPHRGTVYPGANTDASWLVNPSH